MKTTGKVIRVLLADDHEILLEGLRELLNKTFTVVGCANSGRQLVAMALHHQPEIVVTDINMPDLNGVEAVRQIRDGGLKTRAVFLTMLHDAGTAMRAFQAGGFIAGYVLKNSAGAELVTAIHDVLAGRSYMTPRITRDVLLGWCTTVTPIPGGITPRQVEVLRLIAQGKTMKEVASQLEISTRTAEAHKYQMMDHLGFRTSAQLIRFAVQHDLLAGRLGSASYGNSVVRKRAG
ncbi:MAG TPA: response regulator transcription factor [Verrucomicrobiae bacterium]|jgi:DNA-binding NarL/FixJ family response regulator|nr:response regulator transcription factor [Verrucomicrobiae bacterium]